ncbi:MAG: hypothetical protein JJ693_02860 [Acidithiobacillus sp.]|nr:hypothetical protein [Acidithiobacillus sp.]
MKLAKWGWTLLILAIVLYLLTASFYVLRPGESALLLRMGRVEAIRSTPGLYLHWPFLQSVQLIDTRQRSQSTKAITVHVSNGKDLQLNCFVEWHIADPARFYERGLNMALAESQVSDTVISAFHRLLESQALQNQPDDKQLHAWQQSLLQSAKKALTKDGIGMDSLHFLEIGLTSDALQSTYRQMRAKLQSQLEAVQLAGKDQVNQLQDQAEKKRQALLSDAYTDAQQTIGKAREEAAKIYAASYGKDPRFFAFYRSLELLREIKKGDVLVLPESSPLVQYLRSQQSTIKR